MLKATCKAETNNLKLDPPRASQKLALSLCRPVGLSFIWVVLLVATAHASSIQLNASYYSYASLRAEGTWKHGERRMANGERFDETKETCAAGKQWKLNTYLRIRNNENGKEVVVKVTDRIAKRFYQTRCDLSKKAFEVISGKQGFKQGLLQVSVEEVK